MAISVAYEGSEGVGKTSLTEITENLLKDTTPFPVMRIYEPGKAPASIFIRKNLLRSEEFRDMDPITHLLLYTAARNETFAKVIVPFQKENPSGIIIADRFWFSSLVYQVTDGVDKEYVKKIQEPFMSYPDKVYLIDVPTEESLFRLEVGKMNGRLTDWRDEREFEIFDKNRARYHELALEYKDRVSIIDGFQNVWKTAFFVRNQILEEIATDERFRQSAVEALNFSISDLNDYIHNNQEKFEVINRDVMLVEEYRKTLNGPPKEALREKMHQEWIQKGLIENRGLRER